MSDRKQLAIVGTGIAGSTAAYYLHPHHDLQIFEKGSYIGGHTNTIDIELAEGPISVDTGFIVHNDRTYPNFLKLLEHLQVKTQDTEMSFSVKDESSGLEYNGGNLNKLFAQRRNLIRPDFYRLLREILRFNKQAQDFLNQNEPHKTLGEYLHENHFKQIFIDKYLVPMGASIWSTVPQDMLKFPAQTFIRFFQNHGLLDLNNRPQWRTISGGSREYVKKMTAGFKDRIHLHAAVKTIKRQADKVVLQIENGESFWFDEVILATHSDQALALLSDPTPEETRILSAIPYQDNIAILHTDTSLLPRRKLAWASWNYHLDKDQNSVAALTYNMNILQQLPTRQIVNVTLNREEFIDPEKIHRRISYQHPLFTTEGLRAQQDKHLISGQNRTWYCGAYWHNGFHEDGVVSALDVVQGLGGQVSEVLS